MSFPSRTDQVGFWASVELAGATVVFAASLVATLVVRLGPTLSYVASLLLAPGVVCLMAASLLRSTREQRIFGLLAFASSVLYAPLCMATYFIQLAVVSPGPQSLSREVLGLVAFVPGSATFAIDMLGYVFLCLSTLCVAFTLTDAKDRGLRILCIIHGFLLFPTAAAPLMSGMYRTTDGQANDAGAWVNLFWCAVFTPIAVLFALSFRRGAGKEVLQ